MLVWFTRNILFITVLILKYNKTRSPKTNHARSFLKLTLERQIVTEAVLFLTLKELVHSSNVTTVDFEHIPI